MTRYNGTQRAALLVPCDSLLLPPKATSTVTAISHLNLGAYLQLGVCLSPWPQLVVAFLKLDRIDREVRRGIRLNQKLEKK